ncbi:uncharacterized protein TNCV_66011 [Trichonephila clavipes]|nr:uncharacterized protein TNCV_66011 [Trichonephila clavipes]
MEQSNKNITNAETLTSERERNLAKENGETQQANSNDENMQDYDDQQPSEKDIVQPEDISKAPTEKRLENVGIFRNKWANCRGQSFNNAANMSGRYNGVQTLLKEKNKFTNYASCAAHSLNLVCAESDLKTDRGTSSAERQEKPNRAGGGREKQRPKGLIGADWASSREEKKLFFAWGAVGQVGRNTSFSF